MINETTIRQATFELLKISQKAREDGNWCVIQVLRKLGFNFFIPHDQVYKMPKFESILRAKRDFLNTPKGSGFDDRIFVTPKKFVPEPNTIYNLLDGTEIKGEKII